MFGIASTGALNRHSRHGSCQDGDGVNSGGVEKGLLPSDYSLMTSIFDMGMMALDA